MKPVEVYCCGEIITCNETVNACETCGTEYDIEGDKIHETTPWDEDSQEDGNIIIVNE
jgi:hypothetical protein